MSHAICGGLVSESTFNKKPRAYMMAYVMSDKYFKRYNELVKAGKTKQAQRLRDKHAYSVT